MLDPAVSVLSVVFVTTYVSQPEFIVVMIPFVCLRKWDIDAHQFPKVIQAVSDRPRV